MNTNNISTMKKLIFPGVFALLSLVAFGQDCEPYIPMVEGTIFEQTSYNPKGKIESRSEQKIISKEISGDDLVASVEGTLYDKKDKELNTISYVIKCVDGNFSVDMGSVVRSDSWEQYRGMTVDIDGDFMDLPSDPEVGDELDDARMTVSVTNAGVAMVTIEIHISNRRVAAKEEVTTDAGTFDCVVFSYDVETEIGGMLPIKIKASSKDWYAKNAGLVKQETFDKKGKMTGYTLLTKLDIP